MQRLLNQAVHHRRNAQRPHPTIGLRNVHPAYRLRHIRAERSPARIVGQCRFRRSLNTDTVMPSTPAAPPLSGSCSSVQRFAYSFLQIRSRPRHPRRSANTSGIARAHAFAAGLLPDPQLGTTSDHPTDDAAGTTNAFNVNPGFDVNALLLRSSRVNAAAAQAQRISLELLWQEWQVVSQARPGKWSLLSRKRRYRRLRHKARRFSDRRSTMLRPWLTCPRCVTKSKQRKGPPRQRTALTRSPSTETATRWRR